LGLTGNWEKPHARRTDPSYIRHDRFLGFCGHLAAKANENARHTSA
jgi:hypothetical protein